MLIENNAKISKSPPSLNAAVKSLNKRPSIDNLVPTKSVGVTIASDP